MRKSKDYEQDEGSNKKVIHFMFIPVGVVQETEITNSRLPKCR